MSLNVNLEMKTVPVFVEYEHLGSRRQAMIVYVQPTNDLDRTLRRAENMVRRKVGFATSVSELRIIMTAIPVEVSK